MGAISLKMEGVTRRFPGASHPAVDAVDLEIKRGHIASLVGPSGSGKTTILRLLAGLESPERGQIFIDGRLVSSISPPTWIAPEKRGVGMVFQEDTLLPHLTAQDNVGFGLGRKNRKERVSRILSLVGLEDLAGRYPHQLSGGQKQRVALARALVRRPSAILLDEPFSSLDKDLRRSMRLEVARIVKEAGATAVMVSHDQEDALSMSDQVAVIKDGRVLQTGSPREVYRYPNSEFVATFLGDSNIVPGRMMDRDICWVEGMGPVSLARPSRVPPGTEVRLCLRPELLLPDKEGSLRARVVTALYEGAWIRAWVRIHGTSWDLLMWLSPDEEVWPGDEVGLRVASHQAVVLTPETGMDRSPSLSHSPEIN